MFGFVKDYMKKKRLLRQIELASVKKDLQKLKRDTEVFKTQRKQSKWDKLRTEYDGIIGLVSDLGEDFNKDGLTKLLENPMVMEFLQKSLGHSTESGIEVSDREKKLNEIISNLPPEITSKIGEIIGEKTKK